MKRLIFGLAIFALLVMTPAWAEPITVDGSAFGVVMWDESASGYVQYHTVDEGDNILNGKVIQFIKGANVLGDVCMDLSAWEKSGMFIAGSNANSNGWSRQCFSHSRFRDLHERSSSPYFTNPGDVYTYWARIIGSTHDDDIVQGDYSLDATTIIDTGMSQLPAHVEENNYTLERDRLRIRVKDDDIMWIYPRFNRLEGTMYARVDKPFDPARAIRLFVRLDGDGWQQFQYPITDSQRLKPPQGAKILKPKKSRRSVDILNFNSASVSWDCSGGKTATATVVVQADIDIRPNILFGKRHVFDACR